MNRTTRSSVAARTRALARLRAITIGTTMAGLAGVAGFGTIAAISNSGAPSTTVAAGNGSTTDTGASDQTTTTPKSTTTTNQLAPIATPRPTRRPAHVTTGGSG